MTQEAREIITLFDDVPADSEVVKTYELPRDGTVEGCWLRNYVGHGFDLRYHVEVESQDGRVRSVFRHLGQKFVTGDDDTHDLTDDLREPVEAGERIRVRAVNNETGYSYHANARVTLDYEGGTGSWLGGVL